MAAASNTGVGESSTSANFTPENFTPESLMSETPPPAGPKISIPKLVARIKKVAPPNPTPVPETPTLPSPTCDLKNTSIAKQHTFSVPRRRILTPRDHELFLESPTCKLLQAWVFGLSDSVIDMPAGVYANVWEQRSKEAQEAVAAARKAEAEKKGEAQQGGQPAAETQVPVSATTTSTANPRFQKVQQLAASPIIFALLNMLDETEGLVYAHPPDDEGGSRFGNKRFRDFIDDIRRRAPMWHRKFLVLSDRFQNVQKPAGSENPLPSDVPKTSPIEEVAAYFTQSFGNRARIDYGSGHELHFIVWLLCLYQLGSIKASDMPALVLCVMSRYLEVMRLVQTTYYLEPAGSHGVWGLDDYQFLPFLFGAAQLENHRYITPRAVHQPLTLEQFGDDYLYLGQVRFVNSIKVASDVATMVPTATGGGGGGGSAASGSSGPSNSLRWHSPMLDDISASKTWSKIEGGMRRMFVAEVLKKLPVMQHFLFGSLVPATSEMTEPPVNLATGKPVNEDEEDDAVADGNDSVSVFEDAGGQRHIHNPSGWGDCCGIRVPSSLGAAGELRKRGEIFRRIPFD